MAVSVLPWSDGGFVVCEEDSLLRADVDGTPMWTSNPGAVVGSAGYTRSVSIDACAPGPTGAIAVAGVAGWDSSYAPYIARFDAAGALGDYFAFQQYSAYTGGATAIITGPSGSYYLAGENIAYGPFVARVTLPVKP